MSQERRRQDIPQIQCPQWREAEARRARHLDERSRASLSELIGEELLPAKRGRGAHQVRARARRAKPTRRSSAASDTRHMWVGLGRRERDLECARGRLRRA